MYETNIFLFPAIHNYLISLLGVMIPATIILLM